MSIRAKVVPLKNIGFYDTTVLIASEYFMLRPISANVFPFLAIGAKGGII